MSCALTAAPRRTTPRAYFSRALPIFFAMLAAAAIALPVLEAQAKTPGSTYCFVGKCHRVKSLGETRALVGKTVPLVSSHYSGCHKDPYNPCGLTSSGEPFFPDQPDNAASPIYPDGTVLLIRHPGTKASAVVRINNAGPYWGNRKLDVSHATADRLGFRKRGVAKLETRILAAPNKKEARYKKRRRYRPLPGYIGEFDSLDDAERTAVALMILDASAGSALAASSGPAIALAHRRETKKQRKIRAQRRKELEPIVRTMRMIASLPAAELQPVTTASTAESPGRRTIAQSDGNARFAAAKRPSPRQQMARAAIEEIAPELAGIESEAIRPPSELIRTAEVGAPKANAWEDLLRTRLGSASLAGDGALRGRLPYGPLPGRRPREPYPVAPNVVRFGMTG